MKIFPLPRLAIVFCHFCVHPSRIPFVQFLSSHQSQRMCIILLPKNAPIKIPPNFFTTQAPPSRFAYSSSILSSYSLSLSVVGLVGSSTKIPSLINSSGFGRCEIFSFRLSARMCFSNSRCWPWMLGAAVESGRMLPAQNQHCQCTFSKSEDAGMGITYAQLTPLAVVAFPNLSSTRLLRDGVRVLARRLVESCVYPASACYSLSQTVGAYEVGGYQRSSIRVQKNVSILQFLRVRAVLQVLLQRVLADMAWSVGGDGCLVDDGGAGGIFFCHFEVWFGV